MDDQGMRLALGRVFDAAREGLRDAVSRDHYENMRHDFIFHLSDCGDDLAALSAWIRDPRRDLEDSTVSNLIGMLYHVIPHLDAAGRLLLDEIGDPFTATNPASNEA